MTTDDGEARALETHLSRWLALAVGAMLLGAAAGAGFFMWGGVMAAVSDATGALIGLTLVPVALGVHRHLGRADPGLSTTARTVGVTGHVIFAAGGLLLVGAYLARDWMPDGFGAAAFGGQLLGIAVEGAWLVLVGRLSSQAGLARLIVVSALVAGAGNVLFVLGTLVGSGAVAGGGGGIGLLAFLTWALAYRRVLAGPGAT